MSSRSSFVATDDIPLKEKHQVPMDSASDDDPEKKGHSQDVVVTEGHDLDQPQEETVKRNLKQRHLAMIALGGTIGTGLFVGSGSALATGGPVGCLLGYMIMGLAVYAMMVALGEMGTMYPDAQGFVGYTTRFVDPSIGFALGYNYWYSYAVTIPTELVACALVIQYWNATINQAAWITPLFVAIVIINFLGVQVYGEMEFWFSAIKIIAIVGLIIVGIVIDCGGGPNSTGYHGFTYWKNPGPFNQFEADDGTVISGTWGQFVAFWSVFVQAAFSFIGTEILGVTVGEAKNPRVAFPRAIKRTFWRILIFYVLSIFVVGLIVPSNSPRLLNNSGSDASASPFVIAIEEAGIKALPSIINAVLIVAAWSAGNSDLYAASRTLYALAIDGKAPKIFRYCNKAGLPVYCIGITALWGFIAYAAAGNNTAAVFDWLYNTSSITGLITWVCILGSYLRFYYGMKKQGLSRDNLPYKAPFQPYASWIGFFFFMLVILMNGFPIFIGDSFTGEGLVATYICLPIFFCCWLPYKLFGGNGPRSGPWGIFRITTWVALEDIDFVTGTREFEEMDLREAEQAKPQSFLARVLGILF
ncbi:putative amino acid transporter [Mrakia frigida]|uniref:putative amino acid transporter n=1 Tax=Mrakia frigida TaxID=29902 RepID=UPI003FCBFFE7